MPSAIGPALAAAHRMSHRIHGFTSDVGPPAHVTLATRLADTNVLMLGIAQSANRRPAFLANHAHLAARQQDRNPVAFLRHDLRRVTGTSDKLAALAGSHLNIVDFKTRRYRPHRHCVP